MVRLILAFLLCLQCQYIPINADGDWVNLIPADDLALIQSQEVPQRNPSQSEEGGVEPFEEDLMNCRWPNVSHCPPPFDHSWLKKTSNGQAYLYYRIAPDLDLAIKNLIQDAVYVLESVTCFAGTTFDDPESKDLSLPLILDFRADPTCGVEFQSSKAAKRTVWVGDGCVKAGEPKPGIIHHLIMLALGFKYEHTRPDRDQWITIWWDNVKEGRKNEFAKNDVNADVLDPYDYVSVLHPGYTYLSNDPRVPTITGKTLTKLGVRTNFSATDLQKINRKFCGGPRHPAAKKPPFDTIGLATKTKIITTTVYSTVTAEPKFATAVIPPPVIKTVYKTVTVPMEPTVPDVDISPEDSDEDLELVPSKPSHFARVGTKYGPPGSAQDCSRQRRTLKNSQTLIRTTFRDTFAFSYVTSVRSWTKYYGSPDPSEPVTDSFAPVKEYPQFSGPVENVESRQINPETMTLHTSYQTQHLGRGIHLALEKLETRIHIC